MLLKFEKRVYDDSSKFLSGGGFDCPDPLCLDWVGFDLNPIVSLMELHLHFLASNVRGRYATLRYGPSSLSFCGFGYVVSLMCIEFAI